YDLRFMNSSAARAVAGGAIPWPALVLLSKWGWASRSCPEHWQGNPNYSYGWAVPILAVGFGIRRYLILQSGEVDDLRPSFRVPVILEISFALGLSGLVFLLEYSREQM